MNIFGRKHVNVTVHGNTSLGEGADGRYRKQAKANKKAEQEKIRHLRLVPHTAAELRAYIEEKYQVKPLPEDDEIFRDVAGKLSGWEPLSLTCYNIVVMQGAQPAAWLEVYVEDVHSYLAFKAVDLECDDEYAVRQVISDIVRFFGASEEDKKQKNERYIQLCSVD